MKNSFHLLAAAAFLAAGSAIAAPITASFSNFGTLTGATFGGSGIPNDAVAIRTVGGNLTLGLTAHQRFGAPALTNNGAGIFAAMAGVSAISPSPADPYALWNFGYYIAGANLQNFTFKLLYDFDPASGTDESVHGVGNTPGAFLTGPGPWQDSLNLGMDFLATTAGSITKPGFASFDPSVAGQYTFALVAYSRDGATLFEQGRSAIVVNVNAVPEPTSVALVGLALAGFGLARIRKA